ncbi:hypothetical protein PHLGIDRAFT_353633 [Phlebiopsis gigantea 11061_1 CR5-6]|uniref:Uncharacterized protein n=1 Tax=Phlebiopsis gigantea (strain 11061_1 CR5-6) TaxID=745531 RepID=A0A0C3S1F4_PHLG1|nr:hypothetical protein PHLGIDRAFT_353633 [Phlebiopsis gigantea 11061_1 CR5-6]
MHSEICLLFRQYPFHKEPPSECWAKLDDVLENIQRPNGQPGVAVAHYTVQLDDEDSKAVWEEYYDWERKEGWLAEAIERFPKTHMSGRLWAMDTRAAWHHSQSSQ